MAYPASRCIDLQRGHRAVSRFDHLVEGWNKLRPHERQTRLAACRASGHRWEPLSWGETSVCVRCLRYDTAGRSA